VIFTHKKSAPQLLVVESNFWSADHKSDKNTAKRWLTYINSAENSIAKEQ